MLINMSSLESDSEGINFRSYSEECLACAKNYLRERGVSESTFSSHGGEIDPLVGRPTISERLKRDFDSVRRDAAWDEVSAILWLSVRDFKGEHSHWLARPLPRFKNSKFLVANGSDGVPWIPRETCDIAKDVNVPIVITEGPIKALALLQAGAFPISLMGGWPAATNSVDGVDGDDVDEGRLRLHGELARNFQWSRRPVYLCFDANKLKNENVRHAEIRLCFLLRSLGADVWQLSTWPLAEGKGIDDYLAGKAGTDAKKQARFSPS